MRKTTQFRRLLEGTEIRVAPGAFDGLSARLIERAGFPLVYATGGGNPGSQKGISTGIRERVQTDI